VRISAHCANAFAPVARLIARRFAKSAQKSAKPALPNVAKSTWNAVPNVRPLAKSAQLLVPKPIGEPRAILFKVLFSVYFQ